MHANGVDNIHTIRQCNRQESRFSEMTLYITRVDCRAVQFIFCCLESKLTFFAEGCSEYPLNNEQRKCEWWKSDFKQIPMHQEVAFADILYRWKKTWSS